MNSATAFLLKCLLNSIYILQWLLLMTTRWFKKSWKFSTILFLKFFKWIVTREKLEINIELRCSSLYTALTDDSIFEQIDIELSNTYFLYVSNFTWQAAFIDRFKAFTLNIMQSTFEKIKTKFNFSIKINIFHTWFIILFFVFSLKSYAALKRSSSIMTNMLQKQ